MIAKLPVNKGGDKTNGNQPDGNNGDANRKIFLRNKLCRDRHSRIGCNHQRAHRTEMHGRHRDGQVCLAQKFLLVGLCGLGQIQRRHAEQGPHQDGGNHNIHVPADNAGNTDGRHAGEMHGRNAKSDNKAADKTRQDKVRPTDRGNRKPDGGCHNCNRQRNSRQKGLIANRYNRVIGQHCDEVGRPDATAGHNPGQEQPCDFLTKATDAGACVQIECGMNARQSNKKGNEDQNDIVLVCQTVINSVHSRAKSKINVIVSITNTFYWCNFKSAGVREATQIGSFRGGGGIPSGS